MFIFLDNNNLHFLQFFKGLERKSFDNKHVTFEEHVTTEHNMWHYLYFTVLVKVKDPTEFTGPESYVHEMVKVIYRLHFMHDLMKMLFYNIHFT